MTDDEAAYQQVRVVCRQLVKEGHKGIVVGKRDGENIAVTKKELKDIRSLNDFDLTMLLSEIDEFGWVNENPKIGGRALLPLIKQAGLTRG
jgi:hypothetical protein